MKKIISIILLLLSLFCLISCNNNEKKKEDYINNFIKENEDNNYQNKTEKPTEKQTEKPTEITRKIYFETNGGTYISPITVTTRVNFLPKPSKENYTFEGWYINPEFTVEPTLPLRPEGEITLYAKWIKTKNSYTCESNEIKFWFNDISKLQYYINPNGLNLQELQTEGYNIKLTVNYKVYYKKTYDALLDIGYLGAPKYEAYIKKNGTEVASKEDIKASTSATEKEISYTGRAADFINKNIILEFSTNNIQNTVCFFDIVVTYECYK